MQYKYGNVGDIHGIAGSRDRFLPGPGEWNRRRSSRPADGASGGTGARFRSGETPDRDDTVERVAAQRREAGTGGESGVGASRVSFEPLEVLIIALDVLVIGYVVLRSVWLGF